MPAALLAVVWLAMFVQAVSVRLPYPYDLEWMEGGMLAHALHFPNLYGPPRTDFVPFVYPPGYPALLAVLGPSPLVGRTISLLGTLLAASMLVPMCGRRTGLWAALAFLTTWSAGGAFFDLARPDGLFMGLLALGITLAWHGRISAPVLVAAFFVKQSTAFFLPAIWLGIAARDGWRAGVKSALATAGPILIGLGLLGPDAWSYLFSVPASHPLVMGRLFPLAWLELGAALPVLAVAASLSLLLRSPGSTPLTLGPPLVVGVGLSTAALLVGTPNGIGALGLGSLGALGTLLVSRLPDAGWQERFGTALACSALVAAVWMRAHHGGYLNVLIPAFWVLALGTGLVLRSSPNTAAVAFALQFAWALQTPFAALTPTQADRDAGDALVERLKRVEGPVWSPYAVWLPTYAGHEPQAHLIGVWDLDHPGGPWIEEVQLFTGAMRTQHWGAVVTSQRRLGYGLELGYRRQTRLHHPGGVLQPRSGWPVELTGIWIPEP